MLRTISLLALALLVHVTLVAALAHACGPQGGSHPASYSNSQQHHKAQFQLGNRTNIGNKNGLSLKADPTRRPQTTTANQPATIKPQEQFEHPSDLPTNDPPVVATVSNPTPVKP